MNKIIVLNILKELIIKYQNNELDETTYNEILNNFKFYNLNSNLSSFEETSLLNLLFKTLPYYQIFPFLMEFITYLKSISTNNNSKFIASLIEGILCELTLNLSNRTITETNAHIYKLAQLFYIEDKLDCHRTINFLKRNTLISEQLVGLDMADSINFEQESLPTFAIKEEDLREKISKKNYNQKYSLERKILTLLTRFFDIDSFTRFEQELKNILLQYKNENPNSSNEIDLIHDALTEQLNDIKNSLLKNWQKQNSEEPSNPDQINLFTLAKKPRN